MTPSRSGPTVAEQAREAQIAYSHPWCSTRQQRWWQRAQVLVVAYLLLNVACLVFVLWYPKPSDSQEVHSIVEGSSEDLCLGYVCHDDSPCLRIKAAAWSLSLVSEGALLLRFWLDRQPREERLAWISDGAQY